MFENLSLPTWICVIILILSNFFTLVVNYSKTFLQCCGMNKLNSFSDLSFFPWFFGSVSIAPTRIGIMVVIFCMPGEKGDNDPFFIKV